MDDPRNRRRPSALNASSTNSIESSHHSITSILSSSISSAPPSSSRTRKGSTKACFYCQRSHYTCDNTRPCERCRARNLSELCRDDSEDLQSLFSRLMREQEAHLERVKLHKRATPVAHNLTQDKDVWQQSQNHESTTNVQTSSSAAATTSFIELTHQQLLDEPRDRLSVLKDLLTTLKEAGVEKAEERFRQIFTERYLLENPDPVDQELGAFNAQLTINYFSNLFRSMDALAPRITPEQLEMIRTRMQPLQIQLFHKLMMFDFADLATAHSIFLKAVLSMRRVCDSLAVPLTLMRQGLKMSLVTTALARLLGYTVAEMTDTGFYEYLASDSITHLISDVVVPVLQAYLSGNQAYTAVTSITMVRKDGQHVKVRMSMSMMWPDVKGVAPGNMIFIMPSSLSDFQSSPSAMDISEPTFGV